MYMDRNSTLLTPDTLGLIWCGKETCSCNGYTISVNDYSDPYKATMAHGLKVLGTVPPSGEMFYVVCENESLCEGQIEKILDSKFIYDQDLESLSFNARLSSTHLNILTAKVRERLIESYGYVECLYNILNHRNVDYRSIKAIYAMTSDESLSVHYRANIRMYFRDILIAGREDGVSDDFLKICLESRDMTFFSLFHNINITPERAVSIVNHELRRDNPDTDLLRELLEIHSLPIESFFDMYLRILELDSTSILKLYGNIFWYRLRLIEPVEEGMIQLGADVEKLTNLDRMAELISENSEVDLLPNNWKVQLVKKNLMVDDSTEFNDKV